MKVGKCELIEIKTGDCEEFVMLESLFRCIQQGMVCDCKFGSELIVKSDGNEVIVKYNVGGVTEEEYKFLVKEILGICETEPDVVGIKILKSNKKEFRKWVDEDG